MQLLAKFKTILHKGFRATLNFRKFKVAKVALNPMCSSFFKFSKSRPYPVDYNTIRKMGVTRLVFEL